MTVIDITSDIRLVDLMCDRHRQQILDSWLWPDGYCPTETECTGCANTGPTTVHIPGGWSRHRVAIHEAGHAVTHLHHGHDVRGAVIEKRPDGTVQRGYVAAWLTHEQRRDNSVIIASWAGMAAELHWLDQQGQPNPADQVEALYGSQHDAVYIRNRSGGWDHMMRTRDEAACLVRRRWNDIERVAAELVSRGELSGDEIRKIADARTSTERAA